MTELIRQALIWIFLGIVPTGILAALIFLFLTLPQRRAERVRIFLDLLETDLHHGQTPERTILSVSETRERSVGVPFHLLAAYIEEGMTFGQALTVSRNLAPASVIEIIRIGATENTLPQLLPAARAILADGSSRLRGALNYVIVLFFVLGPAALLTFGFFVAKIGPRLRGVAHDMFEAPIPLSGLAILELGPLLIAISAALLLCVLLVLVGYLWQDATLRLARKILGPLPDRLLVMVPWKRRRAQRDLTAMLAVLLDAGMPEPRALKLAAAATANRYYIHRANLAAANLAAGQSLPQALSALGAGREFEWRWTNALRSGTDFFTALKGWHEWLTAKSFQQEQASAHLITTAFLLISGAMVGLTVTAVFEILLSILNQEVLW